MCVQSHVPRPVFTDHQSRALGPGDCVHVLYVHTTWIRSLHGIPGHGYESWGGGGSMEGWGLGLKKTFMPRVDTVGDMAGKLPHWARTDHL